MRAGVPSTLIPSSPPLTGCSHLRSWEVCDAAVGLEPHSSALLGVPALTYKPSRPLPSPPPPGGEAPQCRGIGVGTGTSPMPHPVLNPSSGCGGREGELTFTVRGRSRVGASSSFGHEGRWETDYLGSRVECLPCPWGQTPVDHPLDHIPFR